MKKALVTIGLILLAFANIIGIGYALYLWGATELELGISLWTAFILWLKMIGSGLLLVTISLFMEDK